MEQHWRYSPSIIAVPVGQGSMIAVLGLKKKEKNELIKKLKTDGICEIANDNADGQMIISGDNKSINLLQILLKEKKKKFIPLNVSAPFHCSLMKSAALKMKEKINSVNFEKPLFDIICNVTSQRENNTENIKKLLIDQICSLAHRRERQERAGGAEEEAAPEGRRARRDRAFITRSQ